MNYFRSHQRHSQYWRTKARSVDTIEAKKHFPHLFRNCIVIGVGTERNLDESSTLFILRDVKEQILIVAYVWTEKIYRRGRWEETEYPHINYLLDEKTKAEAEEVWKTYNEEN